MKFSFVLNDSLLNWMEVNNTHLLFSDMTDESYVKAYKRKLKHGDTIIQAGLITVEESKNLGVNVVLFHEKFYNFDLHLDMMGMELGVILPYRENLFALVDYYTNIANCKYIKYIAIPLHLGFSGRDKKSINVWSGYERLMFIDFLVDNKLFSSDKKYFLYGLINPLEIYYLRTKYSHYIFDLFETSFIGSCLVNSIYGMEYSRKNGLFYEPINFDADIEINCLGVKDFLLYNLSYEQKNKFILNVEIMRELLEKSNFEPDSKWLNGFKNGD